MTEAVWTSKTLVNLHQATQCYSPEDSCLHTHHCENLISSFNIFNIFGMFVETYVCIPSEDCLER
jgi:hypothetical protein